MALRGARTARRVPRQRHRADGRRCRGDRAVTRMGQISVRAGPDGRSRIASGAIRTLAMSILLSYSHAGYSTETPVRQQHQTGFATYYASQFEGRRTASGTTFRNDALIAAHPSLPFGTLARVTNIVKGNSVIVAIADRGPAAGPRRKGVIIDLSQQAAKRLNMMSRGRVRVAVEVLAGPQNSPGMHSVILGTPESLKPLPPRFADYLALRMDTTFGSTAELAQIAVTVSTALPQ